MKLKIALQYAEALSGRDLFVGTVVAIYKLEYYIADKVKKRRS